MNCERNYNEGLNTARKVQDTRNYGIGNYLGS